jgi:predicted lipoprotein with Yx(FWY)xxD motif
MYSGGPRLEHIRGGRVSPAAASEVSMSNIGSHRRLALGSSFFGVVALIAAACGSAGGGTPAATAGSAASGATTIVIGSATSATMGMYLTGPNGLALYTKSGDTATTSSCTGTCATNWPPLTEASGQQVSPGTGVTGTFATLTRADGTTQVTYNGLPLYSWIQDKNPGDTTGQGVNGFSLALAAGPGGGSPAPTSTAGSGYNY